MDHSLPGSSVHGFSRQEYWSGLPLPSPYKCQASVRINSYKQFSSVSQWCPTVWDPMDCSTPGFPIHLQLPELTQTHVHWVSDTIQPSHPLSPPTPPALNLSQLQGLFQWITDCPTVMLKSALVSLHPRWDSEVHIFQLFPQLPSKTVLQNIDLFDNTYWPSSILS